jgi:DNA mismatch repair protein MutS
MEDPKTAKGIVKRDIVRVVTPSLVYDSNTIEGKQASYLVALVFDESQWSYACMDYTTGEFRANTVRTTDELVKEISLISPREIIYEKGVDIPEVLKRFLMNVSFFAFEPRSLNSVNFNRMIVDSRLEKSEIRAGKLIIAYLMDTQFRDSFPHVRYFYKVSSSEFLGIDEFTSKNLDLFTSFLNCIDETITPMGGRFIKRAIAQPLKKEDAINSRLDAVELLIKNSALVQKLRLLLGQCSDIERLSSKVALSQYNPRDVKSLFDGIHTSCIVKKEIEDLKLPLKEIELGQEAEIRHHGQGRLVRAGARLHHVVFPREVRKGLVGHLYIGSRGYPVKIVSRKQMHRRVSYQQGFGIISGGSAVAVVVVFRKRQIEPLSPNGESHAA